jgi:hypothetical protein
LQVAVNYVVNGRHNALKTCTVPSARSTLPLRSDTFSVQLFALMVPRDRACHENERIVERLVSYAPRALGGLSPAPSLRGIVSTRTSLIGRTVAVSSRHPGIVPFLAGVLTLADAALHSQELCNDRRHRAADLAAARLAAKGVRLNREGPPISPRNRISPPRPDSAIVTACFSFAVSNATNTSLCSPWSVPPCLRLGPSEQPSILA